MFVQVERSTLCRNHFIDILNGNIRCLRNRKTSFILDSNRSQKRCIPLALYEEFFVIKQGSIPYLNRHSSCAIDIFRFLKLKDIGQILFSGRCIDGTGQGSRQGISQRIPLIRIKDCKRANRFPCCRIFSDRIFTQQHQVFRAFIDVFDNHGNRSRSSKLTIRNLDFQRITRSGFMIKSTTILNNKFVRTIIKLKRSVCRS